MTPRANRDGWRQKAAGIADGKDSRRRRNERRLGGKGLSLEAFANAKSRSSGYNPALIKKQREFYKNAKYVKKYRKTVEQQNPSSEHQPITLDGKEEDQTESRPKQSKMKKKHSRSLKEEYEKKHAEDEKARMEREAIIRAKKEEIAKNEAKRKAQKEKMLKKTRSGQPVMKYRIEHILEGLLESSKN